MNLFWKKSILKIISDFLTRIDARGTFYVVCTETYMKNTAFLLFVIFFEITALLLAVPMEYKSFSLYRQAHADQKNGDVKKHDEVV